MASICSSGRGVRYIQVNELPGRPKIWLGKVADKYARGVKFMIESLLSARAYGQPVAPQTAAWLAQIEPKLHTRLCELGLTQHRITDAKPVTLGEFLEQLFSSMGPQKPNTQRNNRRARTLLEEHFGIERRLDSIAEADADDYRTWLLQTKKLAKGGIGRDLGRAKTFFKWAVRRKLIPASPFADVRCPSQTNPKRKAYVPADVIERVIARCPTYEWKLIFAFARYAGLRITSEVEDLKWEDIDWASSRFLVRAKKVEHHEGRETRLVPIFPELRPHLEKARTEAPVDAVYVIPRAKSGPNLRRYAEQIIERAGVQQWPRLFSNLRASCETDLLRVHRSDAVFGWIGHSARVAVEHYAPGPMEEDFKKAVQITVQSAAVSGNPEPSGCEPFSQKSLIAVEKREERIPSTGIEPVTFSSGG